MYGADVAEIFDLLHEARGKDFTAESADVARRVRAHRPQASSLLDVACGAGSHLGAFAAHFDHVEGVELSDSMLGVAGARLPGVPLHRGDMRDFDLGRTFDAISCMTGSIGYMRDTAELETALGRFAAHLVPGGVAAVDPWWFLETFADGYVSGDVVTVAGRTIARVSHSSLEGGASRVDVHYTVAEAAAGARHFVETHLITLFTREQYEAAFAAAGFAVEYVPEVQAGRGLFVGVRR
ncbi:class I SAM-dependent methyltransferase [Spirillospora sp. NPDC047279]|uniref:class I SAM-dependent methyltransferase n=1 Tax=Spirillospora sp. NPDC047279 TaxID=3155478 RepID=UPI003406EC2E